jgi:two-component system, cell cycle sensor histidine kinase and response regulator CckA
MKTGSVTHTSIFKGFGRIARDRALRDLCFSLFLAVLVALLAVEAAIFEAFGVVNLKQREAWQSAVSTAILALAIGSVWIAYRRWSNNRREIERRVAAEEDRDALREQLTQVQKMKAIGELAGGIAHDFNNLLMVIDGFGRRATANLDDRAIQEECLKQILSAGERGAALTRQLLVFSRRQTMERRVVTVADLIEGVQGLLRHTLPEQFEIRFDIEDPNSKIETDPNEFIQAILNLVINARDAMPDGGRIVISTKEVDTDGGAPNWICFAIRDTGQGIDSATMQRIFEPFFTTKGRDQGTGLGLAMVYGFVQGNGGRIEVSSAVGEGTDFSLYFPASTGALVQVTRTGEVERRGEGETILLVEDNEALLNLVKVQLEELGYNVMSATGAFWALEIDEDYEGTIDLLLTDVIMPGMSGIELVKAMAESRPDMKVIFMSGYTDEANKTGNLPEGATFLQKPVNFNRLAVVLRERIEENVERQQAC